MAKRWYEVRVREGGTPCTKCKGLGTYYGKTCPACSGYGFHGTKKSRFYRANSPKEAAQCYKGKGRIMWVTKASKEQLLGVGEFFKLGDTLLQDLRREKNRRRYDGTQREEEATYGSRRPREG